MWFKIGGFLRDLGYYLTTKTAKEIYTTLSTIMFVMICFTHILLFANYLADGNSDIGYCTWQPSRGISRIYWVIEYIPRKTTCYLWMPSDYDKPKLSKSTEQFISKYLTEIPMRSKSCQK